MFSPEILQLLACPETRQPLSPASPEVLQVLNDHISQNPILTRGGEKISEPISEALLRDDGKVVYPISNGIALLLVEQGINYPL